MTPAITPIDPASIKTLHMASFKTALRQRGSAAASLSRREMPWWLGDDGVYHHYRWRRFVAGQMDISAEAAARVGCERFCSDSLLDYAL